MNASRVTVTLTLAETVETFTLERRETLKLSLAASLGCVQPLCVLELRVVSGSIQIEAVMTVLSGLDGGETYATAVADAAAALAATAPEELSVELGVAVSAVSPVTTEHGVVVPLAVAPPPPPALPPLPLSPPAAPPPPPPPPVGEDSVSLMAYAAIGGVAGAGCLAIALVAICVELARSRKAARAAREAAKQPPDVLRRKKGPGLDPVRV